MSMSFLALMGATHLGIIKCPRCGAAIKKTEDYKNDIIRIPQIGGQETIVSRGEEVTLVCDSCGHRERTNRWQKFLVSAEESKSG